MSDFNKYKLNLVFRFRFQSQTFNNKLFCHDVSFSGLPNIHVYVKRVSSLSIHVLAKIKQTKRLG